MDANYTQLNPILAVLVLFVIPYFGVAQATSNPNLYVSAENPYHNNHFAGSMVVEVVISDPGLADTGQAKGEPDVTINGKNLRMVQATDGKWYAYFANLEKAKAADQIALDGGVGGVGLDFGAFCSKSTTVFGPSFSESNGIAIPRPAPGATNGNAAFNTCTGLPSGAITNNVVRNPKSINQHPSIQPGQINLHPDAWPIIQLFSFSNKVEIQYNAPAKTQKVTLQYDEIPNIEINLDRQNYPPGSEVFVIMRDMQLNQDPTSRDSWTFNVGSPQAVFYGAFTETGGNAANGGPGLVNLISKLGTLGFNKNGKLSISLGQIAELKSNGFQTIPATDGTNSYLQIVTFVESQPNSAIFENFDFSDNSNIKIKPSAPRGQSASIEYNSESKSIISGLSTAGISLGTSQITSGQRVQLTVTDQDQNKNAGARDRLEVFRSSALIPSLTIGNPVTLQNAGSVKIYSTSTDSFLGGTSVPSSIPNLISDRLLLDTTSVANQDFEKISINLGVSAAQLQNMLIKTSSGNAGTNWINYDFSSLQNQLAISDFSDTTIQLFFGLTDATPVTLAANLGGPRGMIQIPDSTVNAIFLKSGGAFLVINFDSSNDSPPLGSIFSETDTQPIVFDLFSFGQKNNNQVNNAIYRFELEETSQNSGIFSGTLEYVMANQLNQFDANLIKSLRTIDEDIKFFVNQRMVDQKGITITYSDVANVGATIGTSTKTDIKTHSGVVSLKPYSIRFGTPVTVTLNDPDLNTKHDVIDVYSVIDVPSSPNVDTVGTQGGGILLEVLIKDFRFKRCTINGVPYGGLAATGFSLVETGPNTGVFEGTFKMPSQICNKEGTKLISAAGGIVDLKYHDFRDSSGQQNIFSLSKTKPPAPAKSESSAKINPKIVNLPKKGDTSQVEISGKVPDYKPGTKIKFILKDPTGKTQVFYSYATKQGSYKTIIILKQNSPPGDYKVEIQYRNNIMDKLTFSAIKGAK